MSWYRQYRPQQVKELHLLSVKEQLSAMLKAGSISHALLFVGPKGTGKTSSARIIAKVVNCEKNQDLKPGEPFHEPCLKCDSCIAIQKGAALHVVEMDAASNRRIDDVRELRERVYMPPASGKKLVYIIDEVHMLTTEAFNALLKILEEPPEHAIFILATTEVHKVPETITSRCTKVQFHLATPEELVAALQVVAKKESVKVEKAAYQQIAQQSNGSFRDAVKMLQQLSEASQGDIKAEAVQLLFQSISSQSLAEFCQTILAKDEKQVVQFFQRVREQQINMTVFHRQLLEYLHAELLKGLQVEEGKPFAPVPVVQFLLKQFSSVIIDERLPLPFLPLELCTLEMILKSKEKNSGSTSSSSNSSSSSSVKKQATASKTIPVKKHASAISEEEELEVAEVSVAKLPESPYRPDTVVREEVVSSIEYTVDGTVLSERWTDFLKKVGSKNLSIEAILRSSQFLRGDRGLVVIQVFYQFHKEQLELARYKSIIEESLQEILGGLAQCEFTLAAPSTKVVEDKDSNISGNVTDDALVSMAEEVLL